MGPAWCRAMYREESRWAGRNMAVAKGRGGHGDLVWAGGDRVHPLPRVRVVADAVEPLGLLPQLPVVGDTEGGTDVAGDCKPARRPPPSSAR